MPPFVTIMIPTYNQPDYIEKAVRSALNQTYENLEVIVSDDSTNNETNELLKAYSSDSRFKYSKNEQNIGRVKNYRHLLFNLAQGEWVIMLDGDDYYIDNDYIRDAIKIISKYDDLVLVGAGINVLNEENQTITQRKISAKTEVFEGLQIFKKFLHLPNHQTDLYKRKLACALDFYRDPSMGSDSESLFRLCLHGKVAYMPNIAATWRIHENNTTFTRDIESQISELSFIEKVGASASEFLTKTELDKWYNHMYLMMANHIHGLAVKSRDKPLQRRVILKFFKYFDKKQAFYWLLKTFMK